MTKSIKKLLESKNKDDVILGASLFCKLNDNPEFINWLDDLKIFSNIVPLRGKIHMNFRFKGIVLRISSQISLHFMYKASTVNNIDYEYN